MPRGHNKKADMSAARWAAKKAPALYSSAAKPLAKPTTISDERPSQRLQQRPREVVPEWAKLQKDEHEKIAGTRVQCLAGGVAVRVILEDGTKFPPHKALAAKRYLRKLAEQKKEKDEIKRMIDQSNFNSSEPSADGMEVAAVAPSTSTSASSSAAEPGSKKARKEAAWKERQQQLAVVHAAKVQEDGRELVSQQVYQGEVVHRSQGRVYVKSREIAQMPEVVLSKLRAATAEIRTEISFVDGELLPICFPDVVEVGLDLKLGVAVEFKVFTDKHGVGGCEAKAGPKIEKRPASEAAEAGSPQKRHKSSPMEVVTAATPEKNRLAAEAAEKAKAEETRLASEAAAKAEQDGLAAGAAEKAKAEETRLAYEAAAKAKADETRLASEAAAKAAGAASAPTAVSPAKQIMVAADKTPVGTPTAASEQATPDSVKTRLRAKTRLSPSPSP